VTSRFAFLIAGVLSLAALPYSAPVHAGPAEAVRSARAAVRASAAISRLTPFSGLAPEVLKLATGAVRCAMDTGSLAPPRTLTVIDYSRPSTEQRMWVYEIESGRLLFHELVAHGRNTGENFARHFSDALNSRQTSLGLFSTAGTYMGSNGYSLRLDGLEPGFNGHARERAIVMHGAPYVDARLAAANGRLGRSWGCPALRQAIARRVIDTISGDGAVFAYYPDADWLKASRFLNGCGARAAAT
jgi:hypothetical protein